MPRFVSPPAGPSDPPSAIRYSTPTGHPRSDNSRPGAAAPPTPEIAARPGGLQLPSATKGTTPACASRSDHDRIGGGLATIDARRRDAASDPTTLLRLAAESLTDVEAVRIATENRIRSLTAIPGWERSPAAARWQTQLDDLKRVEAQIEQEVKYNLRDHPLGSWVRRTKGVGEKQGARLIAAIGDPYVNEAEGRPRRGPAELWAYCGLHTVPAGGQARLDAHLRDALGGNVAAKRRKGERANWNTTAKTRAYLVAMSCMKARTSPYRPVYDRARASWADRETSDAHKHAHGLRLVAKAVLRDLWREAKRQHEQRAPADH